MDEEINYRTLRKIQEIEKNSPGLSQIKPDFYRVFLSYLKNLSDRLDQEKSSQKQILIRDELENTKKIGISIYEFREKKILLAAISKARGGNPELKNLINDEKTLFDSVFEHLIKSRKNSLEVENLKEETKIESKEIAAAESTIEAEKENQNPILRITQDIPEFIGTDGKKYNLKKNDIISLQHNMSDMLIKKGVAQEINM